MRIKGFSKDKMRSRDRRDESLQQFARVKMQHPNTPSPGVQAELSVLSPQQGSPALLSFAKNPQVEAMYSGHDNCFLTAVLSKPAVALSSQSYKFRRHQPNLIEHLGLIKLSFTVGQLVCVSPH